MHYDTDFTALADPSRRRLYEKLRRGEKTVTELVRATRLSQPGVSQHLRVLREARLVTQRSEGTRRYYRTDHDGLSELRNYIDSFWGDVLTAYAADDPNPPTRKR